MFWEMYQQYQISGAKSDAADAKLRAETANREVQHIEHTLVEKVNKLTLICQAMWELMRDQSGLTEQMLLEKVKEIDLRDGKLDGRLAPAAKKCPSCHHELSSRHTTCLYCGTLLVSESAFNQV